MRMYTLSFGQGQEHMLPFSPFIANMPYVYDGWDNSDGHIIHSHIRGQNSRVVSHREILKNYGIKGGHGEYCLETWTQSVDHPEFAFQLPIGGYGDMTSPDRDHNVNGLYLKFDFMYTMTDSGEVLGIHRSNTGEVSSDFCLNIDSGYLRAQGAPLHVTQPDGGKIGNAWIGTGKTGNIHLEADKWHEIQVFVAAYQDWGLSRVGPSPYGLFGFYESQFGTYVPFFKAYEHNPENPPNIAGAESVNSEKEYPLRIESWPANGQPKYPNAMLPGHDQTAWPPENYGSGQYFYGDNLGLVYVWVNGNLDIQHVTNMSNETAGWTSESIGRQSAYLGRVVDNSSSSGVVGPRFFFDNVIMNDIRDPSGSYPSKHFDPPFSSHESLEWNPNYKLKFTAMEMDDNYWGSDVKGNDTGPISTQSRKHDTWLPDHRFGALVASGNPYFVDAPNRLGSSNDSMIPHRTKLTVIHVDWDGSGEIIYDWIPETVADPVTNPPRYFLTDIATSGERYPYINTGNEELYADYETDYRYQIVQPQESNPMVTNADDPYLLSGKWLFHGELVDEPSGSVSGMQVHKQFFYLKRPPSVSGTPHFPNRHPRQKYYGKQPLAGGYGLGGATNYSPNIHPELGENTLPAIYRIWTCLQDSHKGVDLPTDKQYHTIRVPSGSSSYVDFISDNPCPGNTDYVTYGGSPNVIPNSFSMADWPYNPVTNEPWTWDDIDVLQIGACHSGHTLGNWVQLHTAYIVVEHASSEDTEFDLLGSNLLEWSVADNVPFLYQKKSMYIPGWKQYGEEGSSIEYYNRWDISPQYIINRSDRQTTDGQATIPNPQYSGTISYDYKIRYINGDIVEGDSYRLFDELYPTVWVYTCDNIIPSSPARFPFRGEVIKDSDGNYYTFLTHPVAVWNTQKYPTDNNLSPIGVYPYVLYDTNSLYVVPLRMDNAITDLDLDDVTSNWTDPITPPVVASGVDWLINSQDNTFNFKIDPDSYFHPFSPSSVINHSLSHPNEPLTSLYPASRDGHDYYFQAPSLPSGSTSQTIFLTDKLGVSRDAIDNELYTATIGLYQATTDQASNDSGEGVFNFYNDTTLISGYTFGQDTTAEWHKNETTVTLPSGTRKIKFTFYAIRNTGGEKSPGCTLGGTNNFASFDEPSIVLNLATGVNEGYHPADTNQDNRIGYDELANYINQWQSGLLPLGIAKTYLDKAEQIWQSGVAVVRNEPSGGMYLNDGIGQKPENWMPSGYSGELPDGY